MNPAEIVTKVLGLRYALPELEEAINRLKSLGLTEAEQKEALDAAVKLAACSALGLVDVLARIASTGRIDSHDLHALSQRGIAIRVWPGTTQRMAQAATTPQAHVTGAGGELGAEGGASARAREAYFTSDEIRDIAARIPDQMRQWDQMRKGGHVVAPHEHQWFEETTYGDRADGFTEVMECSICGKEEKR